MKQPSKDLLPMKIYRDEFHELADKLEMPLLDAQQQRQKN
jgi:hypothetical protein